MNTKKLYYFRDLEVYEKDDSISDEERQDFKNELDSELQRLADRNKFLFSQRA